jgi:hypothetical protein
MPAIFDLLYQEYCRARLAEMRKQLLLSPRNVEVISDIAPTDQDGLREDKTTEQHEARVH